MLTGIIASIIATLICGGAAWICRDFIFPARNRPEFKIEMRRGPSSSSGAGVAQLQMKWEFIISIYNMTKHDALNTNISFNLSQFPYKIKKSLPKHITALETSEIVLEIIRLFEKETVIKCHDRFEELLPIELRQLKMHLFYENENKKHFHCLASNNDGVVQIIYDRKKDKKCSKST